MTRIQLEALYEAEARQPGDTEYDFYEWAIQYLLLLSIQGANNVK